MTDSFELEIRAALDGLAEVRAELRSWLEARVDDSQTLGDLISVASEFVLHVLVKSGGEGVIWVTADLGSTGVRLRVRSEDATTIALRHLELPPDPLAADALGRRIVDSCCDEVVVTNDDGGTSLECWRRFPAVGSR